MFNSCRSKSRRKARHAHKSLENEFPGSTFCSNYNQPFAKTKIMQDHLTRAANLKGLPMSKRGWCLAYSFAHFVALQKQKADNFVLCALQQLGSHNTASWSSETSSIDIRKSTIMEALSPVVDKINGDTKYCKWFYNTIIVQELRVQSMFNIERSTINCIKGDSFPQNRYHIKDRSMLQNPGDGSHGV